MPEQLRLGVSLWPQGATWDEVRDASIAVDRLGYGSLWSYDHFVALHSDRTVPVLDGWTVLTALGALTSRARLGILVTVSVLCAGTCRIHNFIALARSVPPC